MEITVDQAVAHFQVVGDILLEHFTKHAKQAGERDIPGAAGLAASVLLLQKNRFDLVLRAFTGYLQGQCRSSSLNEPKEMLENQLKSSESWAQLCALDERLGRPGLTSLESVRKHSAWSVHGARAPGECREIEPPSDSLQSLEVRPEDMYLRTVQERTPRDQAGPMEVEGRQKDTAENDSRQTNTVGTKGDECGACIAQLPRQADVVLCQDGKVDLYPEDSSHFFIRKEILEALAQEASEGESSARSMSLESPGSLTKSPWKTNSPRSCSSSRFRKDQETPPVHSPSRQQVGFWRRVKQGLVESPKAQGQISPAPLPRPEAEIASLQGGMPVLPPKRLDVASEACSRKPLQKLLQSYIRNRDKKQSLCKFLETVGPMESDDVDELRAWSRLLIIVGTSLRLKKALRPALRYLLRLADFVSESGWPAPPAVLLVLRERLELYTSPDLFTLLRHKEKVLVKNLGEKLSAIARTVLEWYFLHEATRVVAALAIGCTLGEAKIELLPAALLEAFLTTAAHVRYIELKGHVDKLSNQLLLAHLTSAVTAELRNQMQRYPTSSFTTVNLVRIATNTFCKNLLQELHSLRATSSLEVNRDFFALFEAFLDLDSAISPGSGVERQQGAQIRIDSLPNQQVSPFLADVCQVLEPYVIKWISSLSDQLLRWDKSLVVSLAKQTPTPGSKGKTSRSLRDLFDGIIRIVGSENSKLVYRSAPRYAALLDKALCRVILNRTQAIHAICHKALSQASKEHHLPLPPALKKWRVPATGPVLSPNVCVLLNDMREVRSRFSALVADITAPVRTKQTGTGPLLLAPASPALPATARTPPRPPKQDVLSPVKKGLLSKMWNKFGGASVAEKQSDGLKEERKKPGDGVQPERRSHGAGPKDLDGVPGRKSAGRSILTDEPKRRAEKGDTGVSTFREVVARSLSVPERELRGGVAGEQVSRAASGVPKFGQNHKKSGNGLGLSGPLAEGKSKTLQKTSEVEKKEAKTSRFFGRRAQKATRDKNEEMETGTNPTGDVDLWADEVGKTVATPEERFSMLRVEIEKQYFELVRGVANMITQDFAPFLEAVILGADHPLPAPNLPNPWTRKAAASQEPSDFGLALDARRRLKPLLDYIMETFQDTWNLLDRSILRRLARDTWDSSAEALLGLLPSFHLGNATNVGGRRGPVSEDDDMLYTDDGVSVDLSFIDEAAPRLRKIGAVAAQLDELFGELIVSAGSSGETFKKRSGNVLPASEVPRNVKKLHEVLDVFAGLGSAASWSSTSHAR